MEFHAWHAVYHGISRVIRVVSWDFVWENLAIERRIVQIRFNEESYRVQCVSRITWRVCGTSVFSANLGEKINIMTLVRCVSMTCPEIWFSMPRKKSESEQLRIRPPNVHVTCLDRGTSRYVRIFEKHTGPYHIISGPRHSSFHAVLIDWIVFFIIFLFSLYGTRVPYLVFSLSRFRDHSILRHYLCHYFRASASATVSWFDHAVPLYAYSS